MRAPHNSLSNYYARRVSEYEEIYKRPERQDDLRRLEEKISSSFPDQNVLEIACGTGYWTQFISRRARSILAIDHSREVLEVAKQKNYGDCSVRFQQGDAYSLKGLSTGCTAGFCGFWWSHIPLSRIDDFLAGLHSIVEKGARIIFIDNIYVQGTSTPISKRDEAGNTYQIRRLSDGSEHEIIKNFPSDSELKRYFSGFAANLHIERLSYYWILEYNAT